MKPNKKQLRKWIDALYSGKYKQTKFTLQDRNGYCCLGVACRVLIPKNKLEFKSENLISGQMPENQENTPIWLENISDDFEHKTGEFLQTLNDEKNFTFEEIGMLLEFVYIHKMLD